MSKTYRVVPPLGGIQPASAYFDRVYTEVPANKPDHPCCYEGEWVCSHSPCPVRAVRVRVKAYFSGLRNCRRTRFRRARNGAAHACRSRSPWCAR